MPLYDNACRVCLFYLDARECVAFLDGVPDEIWEGRNDHTKPYPGDHGIQFKTLDESEEEA